MTVNLYLLNSYFSIISYYDITRAYLLLFAIRSCDSYPKLPLADFFFICEKVGLQASCFKQAFLGLFAMLGKGSQSECAAMITSNLRYCKAMQALLNLLQKYSDWKTFKSR